MRLGNIRFTRRRRIYIFVIFACILLYVLLRFILFPSDPVIPFISSILDSYLLLIEKFSNKLLLWTNNTTSIHNHKIFINEQLSEFRSSLVFLKTSFVILLLIWLTKTTAISKLIFTIILSTADYLFESIYLAVGVHLSEIEPYDPSVLAIPHSVGNLFLLTLLLIWYSRNKESVHISISKVNLLNKLIGEKIPVIFILGYVYIIIFQLLLFFFGFYLWTEFLIWSAQNILKFTGAEVNVEPYLLVGKNGSVYITEGCLGFKTMFVFTSLIYLISTIADKRMWIYILTGLLIINIANILRLVFLYLYIQEHGITSAAYKFHDHFNYLIYFIVFILWVIWIEKVSNIRQT